uniref:(northern house mosquito) hypothetical protein n=1 Tax=Culex pipiens TaxID=7175 RepID=A0A8D8IF46_CULPI
MSSTRSSMLALALTVLAATAMVHAAEQRLCGRHLVNALAMLCDEFPDLHFGVKKSTIDFDRMVDYPVDDWMASMMDSSATNSVDSMMDPSSQQQTKMPVWMTMMYPQNYGFRAASTRNDLIPARFRKSVHSGIVDECCLRSCSINQLMKYCKTVNA